MCKGHINDCFLKFMKPYLFLPKKKEKRKKKPYLPESFRSSRKLMLKVAPYRQTIVTTQNFGLQICQNKNKKKVKGHQLEKY